MNTQLIQQMTEVVEATMQHFKSDFYKYDKPYVEAATPDKFPMIWSVAKCHTSLDRLMEYETEFNEHESVRMSYARGVNPYAIHWESGLHADDTFYLLMPDGMRVINRNQVKEIVRDVITPVINKWEREHGKLEKPRRLEVKLRNTTLSELKELVAECRRHGDDSLMTQLKNFHNWRRLSSDHYISVSYNKARKEFSFCEMLDGEPHMCGGIVFHGWPETGYQHNFSVQLVPSYGWDFHS